MPSQSTTPATVCTEFSPNPPILGGKTGVTEAGSAMPAAQSSPCPDFAASSSPHLEGCSQLLSLSVPLLPKIRSKICKELHQLARGIQLRPRPQSLSAVLARGPCAGGQLVSSLGAAVGKRGAVGCRCAVGRAAGSLGSGWLTRKHFSLCAFSMLEKRKRWPHTSHG